MVKVIVRERLERKCPKCKLYLILIHRSDKLTVGICPDCQCEEHFRGLVKSLKED